MNFLSLVWIEYFITVSRIDILFEVAELEMFSQTVVPPQ